MKKRKIPGMDAKKYILARAANKLYKFTLENGMVRGALVHGSHMIKEMRANHQLGILETLVLGHAYLGAGLMTANLKGQDQIAFKIDCTGPVKGLSVEANAFGEVRGYLKNNPIPIDTPPESFDIAPFIGEGVLEVIRFPEFAKQPYVGRVNLEYGGIARNLAHYFLTSEQTPTSFSLGIKFDPQGMVTGAGGLFLQAMPGADKETVGGLEYLVHNLPSLGEAFSQELEAEEFIREQFADFSPKILANRRIAFFCRCRKERIGQFLGKMPIETLADMLEKGPFPVEIRCHNCNTAYNFEKEEIRAVYDKRFH